MTISIIAATGAFLNNTTTAVNTTGANLIVIGADDTNFGTPSDNKGNTYTGSVSISSQSSGKIWYCNNPTVGTGHTFTPGGSNGSIQAIAVSGALATGAPDVTNATTWTGDGSTTFTESPGSVTPTQNGELCVALYGISIPSNTGGTPFSVNSGFTIQGAIDVVSGSYFGTVLATLVQGTAAAVNPTLTRSNAIGAGAVDNALIATFKATPTVSTTVWFGGSGDFGNDSIIPLVWEQVPYR